jgi:GNAT superfamily N-acetyltransferase
VDPSSCQIDEASPDDVQALEARLDAFNAARTGRDDRGPLRLAVRAGSGELIGGLIGVTTWGWLYVSLLWVDEAHRGQGLGTRLLEAAEAEARRRGCRDACLTTFSFQAGPFYEKRGYEVFGRLEDYPEGEALSFLRKRL